MLKEPKPAYKRYLSLGVKAVFFAEALGIAVSYGLWYKLNTSRDFRLYMYKNYNFVVEGYYGLGETLADHKVREIDLKVWKQEGKI